MFYILNLRCKDFFIFIDVLIWISDCLKLRYGIKQEYKDFIVNYVQVYSIVGVYC